MLVIVLSCYLDSFRREKALAPQALSSCSTDAVLATDCASRPLSGCALLHFSAPSSAVDFPRAISTISAMEVPTPALIISVCAARDPSGHGRRDTNARQLVKWHVGARWIARTLSQAKIALHWHLTAAGGWNTDTFLASAWRAL